MTVHQVFDYFAVRLDGPAAVRLGDFEFVWRITDTGEEVGVQLSNGTLHATVGRLAATPVATVRSTRAVLDRLVATGEDLAAAVADGDAVIEGDGDRLIALWALLDHFPMFFPIVEP